MVIEASLVGADELLRCGEDVAVADELAQAAFDLGVVPAKAPGSQHA